MVADPADAVIASWKRRADTQLSAGSPFSSACEQMEEKGIQFKVRVLTLPGHHELQSWEDKLAQFLSEYGFQVEIERGLPLGTASLPNFDDADVLIVLPLSSDIEAFCLEFAKERGGASRMLICVPEGHDRKLYCRRAREVYGVETIPLPVAELVASRECRFGVDVVRHCASNLMKKVVTTIRQLRIENTVVILVHGIWTRAMWQGVVKKTLEDAGLLALPTNYNKFDVLRFLLPFERFKAVPVRRVSAEVSEARNRFRDGHISILAHSFGTYITGKLLSDTDYRFDKIAFCGSVLRDDFDFASANSRFSTIINEIGCRDVWPAIAAKISWGYGATGSFGFNRGNYVTDRKHKDYGHSRFLNRDFCERFWVPFFLDGRHDDAGDVNANPSFLVWIIDHIFFAKTLFWGSLAFAVVWALWKVASLIL